MQIRWASKKDLKRLHEIDSLSYSDGFSMDELWARIHDRRTVGMVVEQHEVVGWLSGKLNPKRKKYVVANVRETNLSAQLFLRDQGFRAVHIRREDYIDTWEDAYVMRYSISEHQTKELASGAT